MRTFQPSMVIEDPYERPIAVDLLHSAFDQLISIGRCISIDISSFREAPVYQRSLRLSPQDSIIYSTIVADLKNQPQDDVKCFLSRDRKAFGSNDDRSVKAELGRFNCRYIGNFTQGLDFIHSSLKIE